ncbi:DUF3068 domain-containing protein [Nocardioides sp. KIGAM211]|uniref:DUF3068 domain-containing protein n=1 Tax=Nocardioides luti TaxID=2761101 RepID=A0A7X0V944_9ACTN|nr:DUF3068 domain-containing protein [Nocardioides luti]
MSLAFVGGFLVVLAVLCQFYAPGALKKTPIDVNNTTYLSGTAQLSDGSGGMNTSPVVAISITHADSAKSDDDVVVMSNSSCLVKAEEGDQTADCVSSDDPKDLLINAGTDNFAEDRVTGLAVNDPKYLPADAAPHEGLINKWPFDAQKKTYPYWSGDVGAAVDAVYDRTEDVEGIECYVYKVTISDQPIEIADGVDGLLNSTSEIFVEPTTGAIQNQVEHIEQSTADGDPVAVIDIKFTDDQLKKSADEVGPQADQLTLLTTTVPVVGYAVGIPLLLIGLGLLFLGRNQAGPPAPPVTTTKKPAPAGAK